MFIVRYTWKAKTGFRDEVIQMVKAMVEELGLTPRVCTYEWGSTDIVTSDLEFETVEGFHEFYNSIDQSQPAWVEWHTKWPDLAEDNWSELLRVH